MSDNSLLKISPDEQQKAFSALKTPRDVAKLLDYTYPWLVYQIHKDGRYEVFTIPKKMGGVRLITAPSRTLKFIQQRLNEVLQNVYVPKPVVYGFVKGKNVVDNANKHKKKNWVLNIDLENFFPSINFGRVRGMFMGKPYNLPADVATVLANICCFNNELPQGAPTSPVISNMLCAKMDSQLQDLAWKHRCFYTRYADDITFSTTLRKLHPEIAKVNNLVDVELGEELTEIIQGNDFRINAKKVRAYAYFQRQEVTGLTVNKFPNVRRKYVMQIRAMLHAWDTKGLDAAELEHNELYDKKHRNPKSEPPAFKKVVKGKIDYLGMVKGKNNKTYLKYKQQYHMLILREKGLKKIKSFGEHDINKKPRVYTEGITDTLILSAAWQKLYPDMDCPFIIKDCHPTRTVDSKTTIGGTDVLKNLLRNLNDDAQFISIGIFDRDDAGLKAINDLNNYVMEQDNDWKISNPRKAGCFALPIIPDREKYADAKNLCIEYFFSDDVISRRNPEGKGLSLSIYLGNREISVTDDPETSKKYPDLRKIKDDGGKMVFASEIVPMLDASHFAPFKLVFDKLFNLVEKLENQ